MVPLEGARASPSKGRGRHGEARVAAADRREAWVAVATGREEREEGAGGGGRRDPAL